MSALCKLSLLVSNLKAYIAIFVNATHILFNWYKNSTAYIMNAFT